jgi:hypothetical protein
MEFIADRFRLWIYNDVHISRSQSPAEPKKSKGKAGRQLKSGYEHMTTDSKQLLDSLFGSRMMWNVSEVGQRAFFKTTKPVFVTVAG